jgi:Poxvirus D5 protein-like
MHQIGEDMLGGRWKAVCGGRKMVSVSPKWCAMPPPVGASETDQVGQFLEERCLRGEYLSAKARKLYTEYRHWAEEIGEDVMTERAFGERILAQGIEKKHRNDGNWSAWE